MLSSCLTARALRQNSQWIQSLVNIPTSFKGTFPAIEPKLIEIKGDAASEEYMFEVADNLQNINTPLNAAATFLQGAVDRRFKSESDAPGVPWQSWSDKYEAQVIKWVSVGEHIGKKLQKSGLLRRQATSRLAFIVSKDAIFYNFNVLPDYGAVQNFGGKVGRGGYVPPREYIAIDAQGEEEVYAIFIEWLLVSTNVKKGIGGGAVGRGGYKGQFVSLRNASPFTGLG